MSDDLSDHDLLIEVHRDVRYICQNVQDHEGRLRQLEEAQHLTAGTHLGVAKVAGAVSAAVAIIIAGLQFLASVLGGG